MFECTVCKKVVVNIRHFYDHLERCTFDFVVKSTRQRTTSARCPYCSAIISAREVRQHVYGCLTPELEALEDRLELGSAQPKTLQPGTSLPPPLTGEDLRKAVKWQIYCAEKREGQLRRDETAVTVPSFGVPPATKALRAIPPLLATTGTIPREFNVSTPPPCIPKNTGGVPVVLPRGHAGPSLPAPAGTPRDVMAVPTRAPATAGPPNVKGSKPQKNKATQTTKGWNMRSTGTDVMKEIQPRMRSTGTQTEPQPTDPFETELISFAEEVTRTNFPPLIPASRENIEERTLGFRLGQLSLSTTNWRRSRAISDRPGGRGRAIPMSWYIDRMYFTVAGRGIITRK